MIVLASRPKGEVTPQNFRLQDATLPDLADGEVLIKNHFLSLDPYMRGRMDESKSYVPPQPLDKVMEGGTAGEVVASKHPGFSAGDKVIGRLGWQLFAISNGTGLTKVDTTQVPLSAYLGCVGMPGVTAWYGLNQIIAPKAGETVVVSAASGAVGSVVGQLAKAKGCRVVGVAGGPDKCRAVVGFNVNEASLQKARDALGKIKSGFTEAEIAGRMFRQKVQAWASQPRWVWGASPSRISGRCPRQPASRRLSVLPRRARAVATASGLESQATARASARIGRNHVQAVPLW